MPCREASPYTICFAITLLLLLRSLSRRPSMTASTSSSRMMRYSSPSSLISWLVYLPNRITSPALTSSGTRLPSSLTLPLPAAITVPCCGFSLADVRDDDPADLLLAFFEAPNDDAIVERSDIQWIRLPPVRDVTPPAGTASGPRNTRRHSFASTRLSRRAGCLDEPPPSGPRSSRRRSKTAAARACAATGSSMTPLASTGPARRSGAGDQDRQLW